LHYIQKKVIKNIEKKTKKININHSERNIENHSRNVPIIINLTNTSITIDNSHNIFTGNNSNVFINPENQDPYVNTPETENNTEERNTNIENNTENGSTTIQIQKPLISRVIGFLNKNKWKICIGSIIIAGGVGLYYIIINPAILKTLGLYTIKIYNFLNINSKNIKNMICTLSGGSVLFSEPSNESQPQSQ